MFEFAGFDSASRVHGGEGDDVGLPGDLAAKIGVRGLQKGSKKRTMQTALIVSASVVGVAFIALLIIFLVRKEDKKDKSVVTNKTAVKTTPAATLAAVPVSHVEATPMLASASAGQAPIPSLISAYRYVDEQVGGGHDRSDSVVDYGGMKLQPAQKSSGAYFSAMTKEGQYARGGASNPEIAGDAPRMFLPSAEGKVHTASGLVDVPLSEAHRRALNPNFTTEIELASRARKNRPQPILRPPPGITPGAAFDHGAFKKGVSNALKYARDFAASGEMDTLGGVMDMRNVRALAQSALAM